MAYGFQLSCESTVDLPYAYVSGRDISVLFYSYLVDDQVYVDDMLRDPEALPAFYQMLESGKQPSTTQINEYTYETYFEELLTKGDVLHIAFGSGMSGAVNNALAAADVLNQKYTDRKVVVIDSFCSSSGYGMLVDYAADMRDRGASIDETADWVRANAHKLHHQFFSVDLTHYRRSGRMSGAAAAIATVLGICPVMRLNYDGKIIAYGKVRGKKRAMQEAVQVMLDHARDGAAYSGKCWVCHSNCLEDASLFRDMLAAQFPNIDGEIRLCDIGTIIASHCGPGTAAVFFLGDERPE